MQKIAGSLRGAQVDRLVPFSKRRAALADERQRHAARPFAPERHRHAGDGQRRRGQRRGRRQDAVREVVDVQVFAVERLADLSHLRVEHHANGAWLRPHRQGDAEIANHRANHVAGPPALVVTIGSAAAQPDPGGIDRFLAERAESLALERRGAVLHLAAGEEDLEAVVGGARQHHAAQDFDPFLRRQRRLDRRAAQEAVARLGELAVRLRQPHRCRRPRRRVGQAFRQLARLQASRQLPPDRGPQGVDLRFTLGLRTAGRGFQGVERMFEREGIALGHEGAKAARDAGQLFEFGGPRHGGSIVSDRGWGPGTGRWLWMCREPKSAFRNCARLS